MCLTARYLAASDLLDPVLSVTNSTQKQSLLKKYGDFRLGHVQQLLNDTTGRVVQLRAAGLVSWIRRVVDTSTTSLIAAAVEYTCGRIQNEAGYYRRFIFSELQSQFLRQIVRSSLEEAPDKDATGSLVQSLLTLLRNDLDRRDSVGYFFFANLGTAVLQQIMQHPNKQPLLEIRPAWISFADTVD